MSSSGTSPAKPAVGGSHYFMLFHLYLLSYKSDDDGHGTGAPPSLCSGGIRPTRASTATRRTRGQTGPAGTYSFVSLFSLSTILLFSFFFFLVISFAAEYNDELGRDKTWPKRAATETRGCTGEQRVRILLLLCYKSVYSLLCFFLPYSPLLLPWSLFAWRTIYSTTESAEPRDRTGPT